TDANLGIPILMIHGTQDPMIPVMQAATSRENLKRLGYEVRWSDYPMGHQVCLEEIEEVSHFLQEVL
ncbi:carboxylesterase, partial [Pseudomonadales bacterium]|nr:carboxylesterase [Pseudomonadales bacterium]